MAIEAYSDVIANLSAGHHWPFDGDSVDVIGAVTRTDSGIVFTGPAIAEDAANSMVTNGTTDRVTITNTTDINNSSQTQKVICGWFMVDSIQPPPNRIYGEGSTSSLFQLVMAYGNNLLFECNRSGANPFFAQVFGPALQPNRPYHLFAVFEGNTTGDRLDLYVDGLQQTLKDLFFFGNAADLPARTPAEFADPVGTVAVGASVIVLNASVDGHYQHWNTYNGTDVDGLTDDVIREDLFEKGALPGVTISSDTEANMQIALDALASTVRPDEPLNIRVEALQGGGDLTLMADNITHNPLASIHVQYHGEDTLRWVNTNGSNASIGSTPNTVTSAIVFATQQTLTVTVRDALTNAVVQGARVYIEADTGGDLAVGTVIMSETTNASGVATTTFEYTADQPVISRVRKGSASTFYKTGVFDNVLTSIPLNTVVLLVGDE